MSSEPLAPLYITIGPQCSGKTTYLSKQTAEVVDISIDDQEGIYHKIPSQVFLHPDAATMSNNSLLLKTLYDKTILERIKCPTQMEMKIVLKFFSCSHEQKSISVNSDTKAQALILENEFKNISKYYSSPRSTIPHWKLSYPDDLLRDLVQAMISLKYPNSKNSLVSEQAVHFQPPKNEVDLFVAEAIFNPPVAALEKAISLLHPPPQKLYPSLQNQNFSHVPIAWGNTNTRPRDFVSALDNAQKTGRAVHFVVFDAVGNTKDDCIRNKKFKDVEWELPFLSRKELIQRNMKRFCASGRYVNVKAIDDATRRCTDMIRASNGVASCTSPVTQEMEKKSQKKPRDQKLQLDQALAKLAGFEMGRDRKVKKVGDPLKIDQGNRPYKPSNGRGSGRGRGGAKGRSGFRGRGTVRVPGTNSQKISQRDP